MNQAGGGQQFLFREEGEGASDAREDNAVDARVFLKRMRIENPAQKSLGALVVDTLVVHRQIALVLIDFLVFLLHRDEQFVAKRMFGLEIKLLAAIYLALICMVAVLGRRTPRDARVVGQAALCLLLVAIFSPLLRTLTEAYASDTVYTLVGLCAVVHLYLYDYAPDPGSLHFNSAVSLNAGFLMSLLLASRLATSEAVASFLLSSIFLLALAPMAAARTTFGRRRIVAVATNLLLFVGVQTGLGRIGRPGLAAGYGALTLLVSGLCPALMWVLQSHKHVVRGPWDVVKVDQVELD